MMMKDKNEVYFKALNEDGTGMYSRVDWALPRQAPAKRGQAVKWLPGRWMPKIPNLVVCKSGYHLTDEANLIEWLGPTIYVAEGRGDFVVSDTKTVFAQARLLRKLDTWNAKAARLFAADCAEHVLPIFEARFPDDFRPRNAIAVARAFANGLATEGELRAANAAAARFVANTVDDYAAYAAANAAYAAAAAGVATYAAYAARAAYATAAHAADAAERKWQTAKLVEYLFPNGG